VTFNELSAAQAFIRVNLGGVAWLPGVVVETALARQRLASSCHAHSRKAKLAGLSPSPQCLIAAQTAVTFR